MANAEVTKTCTHCNNSKPLTSFGKHKLCAGGYNTECKECCNKRVRDYMKEGGAEYKKHKREYDKKRRAAGLVKCRRAWRQKNMKKLNAARRQWALDNPEKRKIISLNYKAKRRAIEKSGLTTKELTTWTRTQLKICSYCSVDCSDGFHVDHVFPLSLGGKHEIDNLAISCPSCNLRKSAKLPEDFKEEIAKRAFQA